MLLFDRRVAGGRVRIVATDRADGDLHPTRVEPSLLRERQRRVVRREWRMAWQVHGTDVWTPDPTTAAPSTVGPSADAVVLDHTDPHAVAMWAADCATVILVGDRRLVGVHAGWRGLAAGAVDAAVAAMAGDHVRACVAGPVIHPCCYEFSGDDLAAVAVGVGADPVAVSARTSAGRLALDVPAALDAAFARHGLRIAERAAGCTGCSGRWFSHRTRLDSGRHALVGWWS